MTNLNMRKICIPHVLSYWNDWILLLKFHRTTANVTAHAVQCILMCTVLPNICECYVFLYFLQYHSIEIIWSSNHLQTPNSVIFFTRMKMLPQIILLSYEANILKHFLQCKKRTPYNGTIWQTVSQKVHFSTGWFLTSNMRIQWISAVVITLSLPLQKLSQLTKITLLLSCINWIFRIHLVSCP